MYPEVIDKTTGKPVYPVVHDMNQFVYPYNLIHGFKEAYTVGLEMSSSSVNYYGKVYRATVGDDGQTVHLLVELEDNAGKMFYSYNDGGGPYDIGVKIDQLDFTFDQNNHPFFVIVSNGKPYYYHFNRETSKFGLVELPSYAMYPRCEIDFRIASKTPESDIIIGYTYKGKLCYLVQRELFRTEHVAAEDSKKTMLWRMGMTVGNKFAYLWR